MAREGPEHSGGVEGGGGYSPFSREVTRLRAKEEDFRRNGGKSISSSRVSPVPVPLDINSARSSSRVELMVSIVGKPVAMMVTRTSSSIFGSVTIPKKILASGATSS